MESCEMGLIKYVLFIFNLIFAISGIGVIVAGALVLSDVGNFREFVGNDLLAPPVVLIVVGAIVFVVAFLGCFGAIRESYKLLIAFAVCLIIIFIIELAVGIVAAVYKNDFEEAVKNTLTKSLQDYSTDNTKKSAWDTVQSKLMCCGMEGPNDWQGQQLPFTCCHVNEGLQTELSDYCLGLAKGKYLYQNGCYEQVKMNVQENTNILIGVGIGIAFVEVAGIILACWLAHTIKKGNESK